MRTHISCKALNQMSRNFYTIKDLFKHCDLLATIHQYRGEVNRYMCKAKALDDNKNNNNKIHVHH